MPPGAQRTMAVAALMAIWWITEAIPLPVTALVPLAAFPALGVLRPLDAAAPFASPVIFLFMGGFMLALTMERWGLHNRIGLFIVSLIGTGPRQLLLGFMVATAILSMWVSNTATAAMMLPVGLAMAELLRPPGEPRDYPFGTALLLAIAYAATIGGIGTLIGTPPNLVFAAQARELLGREIGFVEWMMVGVPLSAVFLILTWLLLAFVLFPSTGETPGAGRLLRERREALGPLSRGEALTMIVFTLVVLGWLFREPRVIAGFAVPGIAGYLPWIDDAVIAISGALLLFLLPVDSERGVYALDWETAVRLPWGVLLLFGGGLSLARGFETSGLTDLIAGGLTRAGGLPPVLVVALACATFIALSELASNTAMAAVAMPVLAAVALGVGEEPVVLMAAAALASSAAFMLPVATPPNAIAFGSGYVPLKAMLRAGIWLNLLALLLTTLTAHLLVRIVLGGR